MRIQLPGSSLAPRTCRTCGRTFMGGPRAWYCPDCRAERRRKQCVESKQRKRAGTSIVLGQTVGHCQVCGKEFIYASGNQKYCSSCAPEAIAEIDRQQGRGWLQRAIEKHGQRYADERYAARRVDREHCVECGAPLAPGHGANKELCPACERLHLEYNRYKTYCKRRTREPASFEIWKVERHKKYCVDCGVLLPSDYACNKKYCAACKKLRERYTSYKMTCKRTARKPVSFDDWKAGAR